MSRRYSWPEGHWNWPIGVTHKHGVRTGQMVWVGGQVDLTSDGVVRNGGDLAAQTENAMRNFAIVLEDLGAELRDLVKLLCFYVNDGSVDEDAFLAMVAVCLPEGSRPAVTAVPVPCLAYPGLAVEIEGVAMRGEDGSPLARQHAPADGLSPLPDPFVQAVRCGKMIFVSAQAPVDGDGAVLHGGDMVAQSNDVMAQVGRALAHFGADFGDVVKQNRWYAGTDALDDFEPAALACAAHYAEPGPAATGIPLPRHARDGVRIKIDAVAMLAEDGSRLERRHAWPDSLWDWHVHLPYKHGLECAGMIFLGGQVSLNKKGEAVNPGDLDAQTHQAMQHIGTILRTLGADYDDVCKVMTVYEGGDAYDDLHGNLAIRSSYYSDPGPATTGVPLPVLAYPNMQIEIDIYAMKDT